MKLLILAALGLAFIPQVASSEFNLSGLNTQVQHQAQVLDNHEARITNLEKDTKVLQENTNTPPAPEHVEAPPVDTRPTQEPTVQSEEPPTVINVQI